MNMPSLGPEAVVQRQLDAFNARDVEALLAIYAEDAQMFEHPAKLLASGTAELRARFAARFQEPQLHAALRQRIVMGNIVVDHEAVTRTFPEGPGKIELVMIYQVQDGRIAKAWSIVGPKTLDTTNVR
ncbi:MAG TPA: nuclear transport factor 2 family protein [Candidatus Sulfotelmatobacter sp.]|nr:nuclear transport factor 2 family protein [Candidatus Sulfotelmatobacter sp.]